MDLDAAAAELYAGSPDDFVERRTALVAQARAARDRPLAKEIGALRRPTRTAWLVNRLAIENSAGVAELLALGGELADAQRRRSGPDLRRLSAERRQLVDRLARDAVHRGAEAGYTAADAAFAEVSQSLQAALGDPATAELLRQGRLTAAVSYGGFGPLDLMETLAASLPAEAQADHAPDPGESEPEPEPEPAEPELDSEPEPAAPDPVRSERQQRADAAELAWQRAAAALAEAESDAEAATARADALADRIEELQAELAQTEADEAAARTEATGARRREKAAGHAAEEAEQDRDEAWTALDS